MADQRPQKPRQGWIYKINPYRVSLRCRFGHTHFYDLDEPGEVECKTLSCSLTLNSSRVFRGYHPYVIWTGDHFQDDSGYIQTFLVIPLTSQETYKGLPTTFPVNATTRNGLEKKSYILVHQLTTVEANCFKDTDGNWSERIGQLGPEEKQGIEKRLKYVLDIQENPSEDWLRKNSSIELLQKVFDFLPDQETKNRGIEALIDRSES